MAISGLHHVRFRATDIAALHGFVTDFGMETVERSAHRLVLKTQGGEACCYVADRARTPGLAALAFAADSLDDLANLVRDKGARPIAPLDLPGGGQFVALTDPDGNAVLVVHGSTRGQPATAAPPLTLNSPSHRKRLGENQQARPLGPARLFRLGHMALFVNSFATSAAWYRDTLGLIGSDIYHVPHNPAAQIVGFFRLDRGNEPVDHHVIGLMQREGRPDCHHISFEVQDFEAQFMSHRYLLDRGHEPIWGVGRHPHGSHVFDVWRDPDRYRWETFSDTDLFAADRPTAVHDIHDVQMDVWSSDSPERYFA